MQVHNINVVSFYLNHHTFLSKKLFPGDSQAVYWLKLGNPGKSAGNDWLLIDRYMHDLSQLGQCCTEGEAGPQEDKDSGHKMKRPCV